MMWAQRIHGKRGNPPHELLEIRPTATVEEAQQAFHKIARIAHPDLHRNALSPEDLEMLTSAYALVAGAYQAYRSQPNASPPGGRPKARESDPPAAHPVASPPPEPASAAVDPAQAMSAKALVYYRKAEIALKRGDLKSAILQLKLALSADPTSTFVRAVLLEAEAERAKG
jgi:hypothetical protein